MAYYLPSTLEAFSHLFGVGKQKLNAFGDEFLSTIASQVRERSLEEKDVPAKASKQIKRKPSRSNTVNETRSMLEDGLTIDEIASARALAPGTIIAHIEKLTFSNDAPDIGHLKPKGKEFDVMKEAFEATKSSSLTFVHKKLDEKYSYDELRLARLFI
jgi:ATP-dependent DNA helicase RecQ